jgi:quercetin dioxygenase-like cupin family protein
LSIKYIEEIKKEVVKAGKKAFMQILIGADEAPNFLMRRFIIEPGGEIPLHTNEVEHEQLVLRGKALVRIGSEECEVKSGDVVFIPANVEHFYKTIGDEPFEFICVVPKKQDEIKIIK